MDKHGIIMLYTYISVDLAHHEIFHAKVGKGGIKTMSGFTTSHDIHDYIQLLFYNLLAKSRPGPGMTMPP